MCSVGRLRVVSVCLVDIRSVVIFKIISICGAESDVDRSALEISQFMRIGRFISTKIISMHNCSKTQHPQRLHELSKYNRLYAIFLGHHKVYKLSVYDFAGHNAIT